MDKMDIFNKEIWYGFLSIRKCTFAMKEKTMKTDSKKDIPAVKRNRG